MRVAVFSGGGSYGAFQAGAFYVASRELKIPYDGFAGSSVGGINAAFLARRGGASASEALVGLWRGLKRRDVFRWRPSRWGFATLKPLRERLRMEVDTWGISKRPVRVAAVHIETSCRRIWTEHDEDLSDGVVAGASVPGIFPPYRIEGEPYGDLGLRDKTPLRLALQMGATEIDVFHTDTVQLRGKPPTGVLSYLLRALQIGMREIDNGDLRGAELNNKLVAAGEGGVGKREIVLRVIRPTEDVLKHMLDFDRDRVRRTIDHGMNQARKLLS